MPWFQDPIQSNIDNLRNVRREDSKHFRNKQKEYLKATINGLETNCNIKISDLYRCISDFKKGYQPRTNIVWNEKGDLVADPPPTVFWLGGGIISLSFCMYMRLMMLGRLQYIQQSHQCLRPVSVSHKDTNHQVFIKFQQNFKVWYPHCICKTHN